MINVTTYYTDFLHIKKKREEKKKKKEEEEEEEREIDFSLLFPNVKLIPRSIKRKVGNPSSSKFSKLLHAF